MSDLSCSTGDRQLVRIQNFGVGSIFLRNCRRLLGWITILCDFIEQIGLVTKEEAPRAIAAMK
jgi:hypothetical protein